MRTVPSAALIAAIASLAVASVARAESPDMAVPPSCMHVPDPAGPCAVDGSCPAGQVCLAGNCFGCLNGDCSGCPTSGGGVMDLGPIDDQLPRTGPDYDGYLPPCGQPGASWPNCRPVDDLGGQPTPPADLATAPLSNTPAPGPASGCSVSARASRGGPGALGVVALALVAVALRGRRRRSIMHA
jgi:hypothetical protein